uniref:Uncharacterized protein n=1 Tax=Graphocephala atropunctata TaxID=36148 RepID=A0A1B6MND0_9HEMI
MKEVSMENLSLNGLMNGVRATRQLRPRVGSSGSGADSPRSLDTPRLRSGSALSSPLRLSRQGTSSPGEDISEDSGIRVNRGAYQSMYQDVINIKALLLRLSRVMQENESDNSHETSQKNGFYTANCDSVADRKSEVSQQEVIADLQRQVTTLVAAVRSGGVPTVPGGGEGEDDTIATGDTTA